MTGFHYPSTWAVLTGAHFHFPLAELTGRHPLTRSVNSGSGNQALVFVSYVCSVPCSIFYCIVLVCCICCETAFYLETFPPEAAHLERLTLILSTSSWPLVTRVAHKNSATNTNLLSSLLRKSVGGQLDAWLHASNSRVEVLLLIEQVHL